jgi:hypothetical protein
VIYGDIGEHFFLVKDDYQADKIGTDFVRPFRIFRDGSTTFDEFYVPRFYLTMTTVRVEVEENKNGTSIRTN